MERKMSIVECEDLAKDQGYDKATFDLVGPLSRIKCRWLDAYMGMFLMDGNEGFIITKQIKSFGDLLWCENFEVPA